MKTTINTILSLATAAMLVSASCKKNKAGETASTPPAPSPTPQEVITTVKFYVLDSATNISISGSPFTFKDPDGEGGQPGAFLNNGLDSLINLQAARVYKTKVILLDETKSPVDTISNAIAGDESYEHMLFYNGNPADNANIRGNTIIKSAYPNYKVKLNGSNITLRYTDADNGAAKGSTTRNIGLETYMQTSLATTGNYPFSIALRHQPDGIKDGTYAPGETDVEVSFKIKVN